MSYDTSGSAQNPETNLPEFFAIPLLLRMPLLFTANPEVCLLRATPQVENHAKDKRANRESHNDQIYGINAHA